MNKKPLSLVLLAASVLVASCANNSVSSSAAVSSAGDSATSGTVSASSEAPVATSSVDYSSISAQYGTFSITAGADTTAPVYDEASQTYTLYLGSKKAQFTLKGYFAGQIDIVLPSTMTAAVKGCTLILDGAYVVSTTGRAVYYEPADKNVEISPNAGTVNYIMSTAAVAIESENNVEFSGAGTVNVASSASHAVKCHDVKAYGTGSLNVISELGDGFHCHTFFTDSKGDASGTLGTSTITVKAAEQAIDATYPVTTTDTSGVATTSYTGVVNLEAGTTLVVNGAKNVILTDASLTVAGTITATAISESWAITPNTGACVIAITGSVTVNGVAQSGGTI
jgi:hypothetical protein